MAKFTARDYQAGIEKNTCHTAEALRKAFESLKIVKVRLDPGEQAYWTLPRTNDEWRLPADPDKPQPGDRLAMLPVRGEQYASNAYLAIVPQPIILNAKVSKVLEDYASRLYKHFPEENTLARRDYDVPMLIGRFDVIVDRQGNVQICELDDVCSLWPALPKINPIANSYMRALETQIGKPIYTAELFQYADGPYAISPLARKAFSRISYINFSGNIEFAYLPRSTRVEMAVSLPDGLEWLTTMEESDHDARYYEDTLRRTYMHNEDHWHGDINDAWLLRQEPRKLSEVALSVRAFRDMPGFDEHLDRFGPQSITMAWARDSKYSLVAEKLGALAANLDVAVGFGKQWQAEHPNQLLVFKALYGARTEHTAIYSSKGTKLKGVSSASQIANKFGKATLEPIVVQPYKEPDSLADAEVTFTGNADEQNVEPYTDRKRIRSFTHIGSDTPGERVVAGMESHFAMIFRSFVIYLPDEKRLAHVGGMWQATDGRIVHGGAHSVAGPLYIDGLNGHPQASESKSLASAEEMLRLHSKMRALSAS